MPATIEFYFDTVSPYTYLAGTQVEALAARHGANLAWKPVLLGKIFEATGNKPPIGVAAKGKYMFRDLQQWARHYDVALRMPGNFPASSLVAQRVACALPDADIGRWAQAVMHSYWGRGEDLSDVATLQRIATELGWDADALLARTQEPAVKERLKSYTDEAVQRGAFGAPTFFVGDEMFWGNDRFVLVEDALRRTS